MNNKKMLACLLALTLAFASVLCTGCGSDRKLENKEDREVSLVETLSANETKEYTNQGKVEEAIATYSSEDGLCVIKVMPSYFDITLDYENGTYAQVGNAYGQTIIEAFPEYITMMEPYIYENVRTAYGTDEYSKEAVWERVETIYSAVPSDYKEEIDAFAKAVSQGEEGMVENGKLSYEEAVIIQLIPDALRPTSCSALSLWGEKTESGQPITLRCLEWNLGSEKQMGSINAVTHMKNGEKSLTTMGMLGLLDVISAVNDDGVFVAILDVGSINKEPFVYEGKKSYTFDIRYALENFDDATEVGNYMVSNSGDYTWCHNLIITDKNHSYCAEDCVKEVADKGDGYSNLRDENTDLLDGLHWDSKDSLCVVNSFASKGNQDGFTKSEFNLTRFEKYNEWVKNTDKFSVKDVKDMITQEDVNDVSVSTVHNDSAVQLIIIDYETGDIQVAFTGKEGVVDKPEFLDVGDIN